MKVSKLGLGHEDIYMQIYEAKELGAKRGPVKAFWMV